MPECFLYIELKNRFDKYLLKQKQKNTGGHKQAICDYRLANCKMPMITRDFIVGHFMYCLTVRTKR